MNQAHTQIYTIHARAQYGKYAPDLDKMYARWSGASKEAAFLGYEDKRANLQEELLAADYDTMLNIARYLHEMGAQVGA